jgi:flagellar motor switch/type III secretory pathway protein FliN
VDVSDALLDAQELEAIAAAIRESGPRRSPTSPDIEPTPLALISDDRLAEASRPVMISLATRWVRAASRVLRAYLPGTWQLDVIGAETIDGSSAKEELRGGWVAGVRADPDPELVVAAHGGLIDMAAAHRCGAATPAVDTSRTPSPLALRLFQPAGRALVETFTSTWQEMFPSRLAASADLAIVSRLIAAPTVVRVALSLSGNASGRITVYARPDMLVTRPAALAAIKANALLVANSLANVPVEVVVELGTLRLPLKQLRRLDPGQTFTLNGFVDSLVPVYCGGVLKAWARPVVCRGVLAAQIETVVHGQGNKS